MSLLIKTREVQLYTIILQTNNSAISCLSILKHIIAHVYKICNSFCVPSSYIKSMKVVKPI